MNKISLLGLVIALSSSGLAAAGEAGKLYGALGADYNFSSGKIKLQSQGCKVPTKAGELTGCLVNGFILRGESQNAAKFRAPAFSAGIGYNIAEEFRTTTLLTYQLKQKDKLGFSKGSFLLPDNGTPATTDMKDIEVSRSGWLFMIDGYYDFINTSTFTPFINAGLGYGSIKNETNLLGDNKKKNLKHSKGLVWNIGAGIAYKIADGLYTDLAYKMINATTDSMYQDKEKNDALAPGESAATVKIKSPRISHSIGLGLRTEF